MEVVEEEEEVDVAGVILRASLHIEKNSHKKGEARLLLINILFGDGRLFSWAWERRLRVRLD